MKPEIAPTNPSALPPRTAVLGVNIDNLTLGQAVAVVENWVISRRANPALSPHRIVTANPEYVMYARQEPDFKRLVNTADMVTPDGIGIIIAGKILAKPFAGRVTGVALCEELFALSSGEQQVRLFLLGGANGIAEEAAQKLQQQYPAINIAGTWAGKADAEGDSESVERIRLSQAEIVLVAYGMVKQDRWIERNLEKCGATVAIGVGGVLDYKSGRVPLAPATIRRLGLEWAYRLYREPWRWRRQLALPRFVINLILARLGFLK